MLKEFDNFTTSHWNWEQQQQLDRESSDHNIYLYKIWNEKVFFIKDAIKLNYYNTSTFAWVDIGCFRENSHIHNFIGFPDSRTFMHDKVTFNIVGQFNDSDFVDLKIDNRFAYPRSIIVGGMFAGGCSCCSCCCSCCCYYCCCCCCFCFCLWYV